MSRITFPICVAYAWMAEHTFEDEDDDGNAITRTEPRRIVWEVAATVADAAANLAAAYELEPASEIRCFVVNFDAPDPMAQGVEATIRNADPVIPNMQPRTT